MAVTRVEVRRNAYVDSVSLLQVTSEVLGLAGVVDAALVMASDLNRDLLRETDLLVGDAATAGPNDLVIAVRGEDGSAADRGMSHAEALLAGRRRFPETNNERQSPRSLRSAHRVQPEAELAVISVPGPYAASEARLALAEGLHVFLFSDNVAITDEVDLKWTARQHGLLVMGPDCGTAILNGIGLGFANVVRRGSIGVVGASGTGIQEVVSLVHEAGAGISHAIGTGSHDLDARVGGITTLQALELLRDDPRTETIVLISKPSDPAVSDKVLHALAATGKPAVAYLQGATLGAPAGVVLARSLRGAALLAMKLNEPEDVASRAAHPPAGREVRGLFCGGTLCQEAAAVVGPGHTFIDFGDDQYTRGRAHPMIDPTLRNQAIVKAGNDARVAVLLLDFVLGLATHPDPASAAAPAILEALSSASAADRELAVVAHVVGTDADPQSLGRQEAILEAAAVRVFGSNFEAARAARLMLDEAPA